MSDEIDQILAETESSTNNEIPMTAPEQEAPQEAAPPPPQTHQEQFYEFNADGRQVKVPQNDPRVKQWLQMGYSAPQRMGQLNSELQKYQTQVKDYQTKEETFKKYQEIDQWASKNPDSWAQIQQAYTERLQSGQIPTQTQLPPEVQAKLQKIDQHDQFLNQLQEKEVLQRQQQADQGYVQTVESLQKQYPQIDFFTPDQNGDSLEAKVLDHALNKGIPDFGAAFKDYYHDSLIKMAEERGREATGKSLARTKNLGLQGKAPAPGQPRTPPNLRNMNYDQITEMALQELGLA